MTAISLTPTPFGNKTVVMFTAIVMGPGVQFQPNVRVVKCCSSALYMLYKSVIKIDDYTFREYAGMHLILCDELGSISAATSLHRESYLQCRL
jgi:hypothetical protein